MTRKSKARYGLKRTYRVNPTVKALRAALMAGLLASASTVALAAPPPVDIAIEYFEAGDITVVNPGTDLYAEAIYAAGGIVAISDYGDVDISNDGNISASAGYYYGYDALAAGIYAEAGYDASVANTGDISAYAYGSYGGPARALGIYAAAGAYNDYGDAEIQNSGAIEVTAYSSSDAQTIGIAAYAEFDDVTVGNTGQIVATSTVYAEDYFTASTATGISGYSEYGDVSITNSGLINIAAYVYDVSEYAVSTASAIGISASGYTVDIDNTGDIGAFASNDVYFGESIATGIDAVAYADLTITNSGDISLAGSSGDGYYRYGYYPNYVIFAGDFNGTGIRAESTYGSISVNNSGDITITDLNAGGGGAGGPLSGDWHYGIVAETRLGDSTISNSGDVSIVGGEVGYGLVATTDSLTFYYTCPPPYDNGNYVCYNRYGGGDAVVVNSGDIDISVGVSGSYGNWANGITASTGKYGGNAIVNNSGDINIVVTEGSGNGIAVSSNGKYSNGNTIVTNSGDITVSAFDFATGINARSVNDVFVYNSGDITVTTEEDRATGIYSISTYNSAYINNSGDITTLGGIGANGAGSAGNYGATTINSGDISVTSTLFYTGINYYGELYYLGGWANGVAATSRFGDVATVINSGNVEVNAMTEGKGLIANTRYGNANAYNYGDITVSGQYVSAYGIYTQGTSYDQARSGSLEGSFVISTGDVTVTSEALAVAIQAGQAFDDLLVYNTGDVSASIVNNEGYGNSFGLVARNTYGNVDVINLGDITVASGGQAAGITASTYGGYFYFYYSGFGSYFNGDVNVVSDGALSVTSDNARATGVFAGTTYGSVSVATGGSIEVSAYDRAFGVDARSNYGTVEIANYADVSVSSSNYNAAGVRALSEYYDATVFNYGDIDVQAAGLAQGIVALSYYGNAGVRNEGDVTASSSGGYSQAVALRSGSGFNAVLRNHGTITAGSGNALAVSITGGNGVISNYGDISGGMLTDAGDDYVRNYEGGRIFLSDDTIDLGGGYNYFLNEGRLYADGVNNVIDMGYYGGGEGGYYYGLFVNDGSSIHMNDGAADDALTVIGNFTGTGDVNVDVDGASLTSDMLYIEGDVLAGTENVINVNLLSLPSAADANAGETIAIVEVSGGSSAADFELGTVFLVNNSLFTADYSLLYDGSEFALGFDVTGLSASGVLLSSLSPAIQNMWYGSLGTMYQRQGGERQFLKDSGAADVHGAAGTWTRIYTNDGSMTPSAERSNFGSSGSQDFSFNNQGIEFGIGYSFSQAWTAGLLGGIVDGNYKPDAGGRSDVNSTTIGGYLTYTPGNGFYADVSYRGFSFDGQAFGDVPSIPFSGDASGYSLELGYGFKTESGLEIEPQLQYSSVDVSLDEIRSGNDDFELTDGDSSMIRAGVALRKSYEQHSGVWTPYTSLNYVDITSASNDYLIGGVLEGGVDVTGGSFLLELGTDAKYGDLLFNLGLGVQDGGAYEFVYSAQMNVRYSW
jgi:Autotransporter beta-domain